MPPSDFSNFNLICTRDQNGLNTGIFFMRVNEWTARYFSAVNNFTTAHPDVRIGFNGDQDAMAWLINEANTDTWHANVLYQPRTWYNAYQGGDSFEGEPGTLLVHFPGLFEGKWPHMMEWFNRLTDESHEWNHTLETTAYPQRILEFWRELRLAKSAVEQARASIKDWKGIERLLLDAHLGALERIVTIESGDVERMKSTRKAIELLVLKEGKRRTKRRKDQEDE